MPTKARTRAFQVVRAVTRMQLLLEKLHSIDPNIPADGNSLQLNEPLLQRISMAKSTMRQMSSVAPNDGDALAPLVMQTPRGIGSHGVFQDVRALTILITSNWLNGLLVAVPFGVAAGLLQWSPLAVFCWNFAALIPLALVLGDVTEDLALRYGNIIGGLLNATFGNVVEIILSIAALMHGLNELVAMSLLGSIFSNLLLVLGCCYLVGGMYHKTQAFSRLANRTSSSLLLLASIGMAIPTLCAEFKSLDAARIQILSYGSAIVLLITYSCYLIFSLKTHADHLDGDVEAGQDNDELEEEDAKELEEPVLSAPCGFITLGVISALVAVHSEYLTGSVESFSETTGLSQAFLGMIVLPIAGNACEHLTAVLVAAKNKMDLSIGIALGSSLQIALFALPLVVLVGWATGHPFSMAMDPFAVSVMVLSVVHSNFASTDATSHWCLGVSILAVYVLIAISYAVR